MERYKQFSKAHLTVFWYPRKCIHSGECLDALPEVFDNSTKPWINLDNAPIVKIKAAVEQCPSGSLTYIDNRHKEDNMSSNITIKKNGPLLVTGIFEVTDSEGKLIIKNESCALCRCGASYKKPFCDGTHREINFKE